MEALYVDGLATHDGTESCVSTRESEDEALTGVHAGQPLSRANHSGVPTSST